MLSHEKLAVYTKAIEFVAWAGPMQIATGSAAECTACLDVLVAGKLIGESDARDGKQQLESIVAMLIGLLNRFGYRFDELGVSRVREDEGGTKCSER